MNDLGVITSNIRVRRKVHNPAAFSMLRNQSRASGGFTYAPPPPPKKAAPAPVVAPTPEPPTTDRYGLRSDKRPARLLAYLHDLADHDRLLPGTAEIAYALGYSEGEKFTVPLGNAIQALVAVGAVTAWISPHDRNKPRQRAVRLADGRLVATADAPEGMV